MQFALNEESQPHCRPSRSSCAQILTLESWRDQRGKRLLYILAEKLGIARNAHFIGAIWHSAFIVSFI
jgi:hypothetical protein